MILELFVALLFAIVLLSAWVTRRIIRDDLLSHGQRVAQVMFVWVLPILGPLLVLHLQRQHLATGAGRYSSEPDMEDFGESGRSVRQLNKVLEGNAEGDST